MHHLVIQNIICAEECVLKKEISFLSCHLTIPFTFDGSVGKALVNCQFKYESSSKFTVDNTAEKSVEMITFSTFNCCIRMLFGRCHSYADTKT
jgi:hypothetical protein